MMQTVARVLTPVSANAHTHPYSNLQPLSTDPLAAARARSRRSQGRFKAEGAQANTPPQVSTSTEHPSPAEVGGRPL